VKELEYKRDVDMALVRRGAKRLNTSEKEDMICAACRTPKTFKGFEALLIHAERFTKENARQHRGYFRALKEAIQEAFDSDKKCHRDFRPKDVVETAQAAPCCSSSSPGHAGMSVFLVPSIASSFVNLFDNHVIAAHASGRQQAPNTRRF
jgi:hypothetical protein